MTNGELIKVLFPNVDTNFSNIIDLNLWWNSQYKPKEENSPYMEYCERMTVFYECNPELNKGCRKDVCQQECKLTTNKEYAKLDNFGNPIVDSIAFNTITTYKMKEV